MLDGVYRSHADGVPEFIEAAAPTEEALHALLQTVIARLMKRLTRRGVLLGDDGHSRLAESDTDGEEARTLRPLQASAVAYRIACGPRAGRRVLTLRGAMPREAAARQRLCADIDGSAFTPRCGSKHMIASGWSACIDTSRNRRCRTSASR